MISSRATVSAVGPPLTTVPTTVRAIAIRRTSRTSRQSPPTAVATSSLLAANEATQVDLGGDDHGDAHRDQQAGDEDQADHQADLRGGAGGAAPGQLRPGAAHLAGELDQGAGQGGAELLGLQQRADE